MPIYMQYEGITGEVTAHGHEGWIELQSVQPAERGSLYSKITVTKLTDSTTTQFYRTAQSSKGKVVLIDFIDNEGATYLRLELTDALISNYRPLNSKGETEQSLESLSLNFSKIKYSHPAPPRDSEASRTLEQMWRDWNGRGDPSWDTSRSR
jgi:type VI secretion system secreted protein Hcp